MQTVAVKLNSQKTEEILGLVASPSIVLSELIKNGFDSNSKTIDINIDTSKHQVTILDKGEGLSIEDIKKLGNIGESDKKSNGNEKRNDGKYLAGSKGLGLLSAFTLSNYIEIKTRKNDVSYLIKWKKSEGKFTYEKIDNLDESGTQLTIKNISNDDIILLTDEEEYKKLRHVTIDHFKNNGKNIGINFSINNILNNGLNCCDFKDIEDLFIYKIRFQYKSKSNNLKYIFDKADINLISQTVAAYNLPTDRLNREISLHLNNNIDVNDIINKFYKVNKPQISKNHKFKYLISDLEDFEGELWISQGGKTKLIKAKKEEFGYGVKVFVNNYAMYGYLDNEKDWLGFSQLSQTKKNTTLKLHNVFGYINFKNFNEKNSKLKIANERANFIEQTPYKKFLEIMNEIIVKIAFEIDVAYRNNKIDVGTYFDNDKNQEESLSDVDTAEENQEKSSSNNKYEVEKNQEKSSSNNKHEVEENQEESLSNNKHEVEENQEESLSNNKENCKIDTDKKPKSNFFNTSKVIRSEIPVNLEYNELVSKLKSLDYKKYYLLYVISFRCILEDLSKRYLNFRNINLNGDFGLNIKNMTDDMLKVCKDNNLIAFENKKYIEALLGGFNAFKNFLESTGNDFYYESKQGQKAIKLNSLVHTPRWLSIEEAEELANDTILPLLMISQEIKNRIIK
ncbi:hypothetical protein ST12_08470 [Clostridium botulinum]|nr:hypothetical protein ST12_08470 [Clostridium botulinum]